jgi:hypothetical protein
MAAVLPILGLLRTEMESVQGGNRCRHHHRSESRLGPLNDCIVYLDTRNPKSSNGTDEDNAIEQAIPHKAMKPTDAGTERYSPLRNSPSTPPIRSEREHGDDQRCKAQRLEQKKREQEKSLQS